MEEKAVDINTLFFILFGQNTSQNLHRLREIRQLIFFQFEVHPNSVALGMSLDVKKQIAPPRENDFFHLKKCE